VLVRHRLLVEGHRSRSRFGVHQGRGSVDRNRIEKRAILRERRSESLLRVAIDISSEGYRRKETHFQEGRLHGPQVSWYHNGDLFSLVVYENGEMKYMREYGPDASEAQRFPR